MKTLDEVLRRLPESYQLTLKRDGALWQARILGAVSGYEVFDPSPATAIERVLTDVVGPPKKSTGPKKELTPALKERAKRVGNLAVQLVAAQVERGDLNPQNEEEMERASKQAVLDAKALLGAVEEYLGG